MKGGKKKTFGGGKKLSKLGPQKSNDRPGGGNVRIWVQTKYREKCTKVVRRGGRRKGRSKERKKRIDNRVFSHNPGEGVRKRGEKGRGRGKNNGRLG